MFEREGIAFAGREVRLRVDGQPDSAEAVAGDPKIAAAAAESFAKEEAAKEKSEPM